VWRAPHARGGRRRGKTRETRSPSGAKRARRPLAARAHMHIDAISCIPSASTPQRSCGLLLPRPVPTALLPAAGTPPPHGMPPPPPAKRPRSAAAEPPRQRFFRRLTPVDCDEEAASDDEGGAGGGDGPESPPPRVWMCAVWHGGAMGIAIYEADADSVSCLQATCEGGSGPQAFQVGRARSARSSSRPLGRSRRPPLPAAANRRARRRPRGHGHELHALPRIPHRCCSRRSSAARRTSCC
jgi:hypothetical protein